MNKDQIVFDKRDDWAKFSKYQNTRILDALSCLFHVTSACAAAILYNNILYVSYNSALEGGLYIKVRSKQLLIEHALKNGDKLQELLGLYLVYNTDYREFIKKQTKHENNKQHKRTLQDFVNSYQNIKFDISLDRTSNQKRACDDDIRSCIKQYVDSSYHDNCNTISQKYYKIIEYAEDLKNQDGTKEIREQLLRPLQDCIKIKFFIDNGELLINEICTLDNKYNIHAEYNITQHFPLIADLEDKENNVRCSSYIGTSKLCCAACHEYLQVKGYQHRGTHGILDQKWQMYLNSPQSDNFRGKLLGDSQDLEPGKERSQYRSLSTDSLEQKCILEEKSFIINGVEVENLYDLKSELKILKSEKNKECSI